MRNEFTAIVQQDGPWHIASCAEVPGANGQGATREESFRSLPPEAKQELVVVG
jgi:predicted RNase H-like HicB family nuclease